MSNDLIRAADSIRNLARAYKNIVVVADVLESIGQLDQAKAERASALKRADEDLIAAKESIRLENEKREAIAKLTADEEAAARLHISEILADAERRAESFVAQANYDAAQKSIEATDKASKIQSDAKTAVSQYKKQVDELRIEADAIKNTVIEKRAELDKIEQAIEQARKKVASLLA